MNGSINKLRPVHDRPCTSCDDILLLDTKSGRLTETANSFNTHTFTTDSSLSCSESLFETDNHLKMDSLLRGYQCVCAKSLKTCKKVVKLCIKNLEVLYHFSQIARNCALQVGKGCIKLGFTDTWSAESFCNFGLSYMEISPMYVPLTHLELDEDTSKLLPDVYYTVEKYNPDFHFILVVVIPSAEVDACKGNGKGPHCYVSSCAKVKLFPLRIHVLPEVVMSSPMILSAGPGNEGFVDRTIREKCLINVQRKLQERGVQLRPQHPKIYRKLLDFVSEGYKSSKFSPLIFYPFDPILKSHFTCIIVPECESKVEWIKNECYCFSQEFSTGKHKLYFHVPKN